MKAVCHQVDTAMRRSLCQIQVFSLPLIREATLEDGKVVLQWSEEE